MFKQVSTIDVYDLLNNEYNFSFSIPNFDRKGITDFKVFNNLLIVLYGSFIFVYELDNKYFL